MKQSQVNRHLLKVEALVMYSPNYQLKCACCGEGTVEFLTIDHIDPAAKNKQLGSHALYGWLKRNNWPPGYQTLCFNCNCAKGFFGACPHKTGSKFENYYTYVEVKP